MEKIAEGKTKIIRRESPGMVLVENKDILSKGDGAVLYPLEGKGICATETTCNVFELLKRHNIHLAYIAKRNERTFRAYEAEMIKIEVVIRRIAFGSYLKRYPEEKEGTIFKIPKVEFFIKDDSEHDPLIILNGTHYWRLYDAKKPFKEGFIREILGIETAGFIIKPIDKKVVDEMQESAERVFLILEKAWKKLGVSLVDLKIEFGFIFKNGKVHLVVADVIDNDSWRIWPMGDKTQMKDKEVFRALAEIKPEDRDRLKENYQWVAEATRKFLT